MEYRTKLSILLEAMGKGDWREANRIASRFGDLGEQRNAILDARTAYTNPRWSSALGKEPEALIEAGKQALIARYLQRSPR